MDKGVTTLAIPVAHDVVTAIFEPPLDPEQQRAVDEATRKAREVSGAVRVLIAFAAQHGRTLSIETDRVAE
jgi:hypothetical protein